MHASYLETHPALIRTVGDGMLEAYAYYDGDGPDFGTVLRFVERDELPGLTRRETRTSRTVSRQNPTTGSRTSTTAKGS